MKQTALVTGGSGFIGSCLVKMLINKFGFDVVNVDNLTYAAHPNSLKEVESLENYQFVRADICEEDTLSTVLEECRPDVIFHLAAESHVDRSIESSDPFIHSNILGTHSLLKVAHSYWKKSEKPKGFRFIHISTDEVYGSLGFEDPAFDENSPYRPSSPYSASKASSDMLVQAWQRTYGFPAIITHCTNNYGEFQNDEKLIPTIIRSAIQNLPIPIYGNGKNIRDWLYVEDHCHALIKVSKKGIIGHCYNITGSQPLSNIEIANEICDLLDKLVPRKDQSEYSSQISYVDDRLGHDVRYAVDDQKIKNELNWATEQSFDERLRQTVVWFLKEYNERNYSCGRKRNSSSPTDQVHI